MNIFDTLFQLKDERGPSFYEAVQLFNHLHAGTTAFEGLVPPDRKTAIVDALSKVLKTTTNNNEMKICATALRILSRDKAENFLDEDFFWHCWKECGYSDTEKSSFELSTQTEIAKCLVNILFKIDQMSSTFIKKRAHMRLASMIKNPTPEVLTVEYAFPLLRILFLLIRPNEDNSETFKDVVEDGIIDSVFTCLKHWTSLPNWNTSPEILTTVREALQVLFSVTVEMGTLAKGPLMSYEKYLPNYQEDLGLLLMMFNSPPSVQEAAKLGPQFYDLKTGLVNVFMNISVEFFRILVVLGDKEATLKTLFDLLEIESAREGDHSNLFPLFVVLKNLFAKAPEVRPYAMERMFPGRDLAKEAENELQSPNPQMKMDVPDRDRDTIGNRIIKLMTSFHQATQFTSNDLLFALVGESTEDFIRLTGFGNAAGLLAMRGLFGMGQHLGRDTLSEFQQAQQTEEAAQKAQEAIDKVGAEDEKPDTPKRKPIKIPDFIPEREGETDEEKEDRMVRNFEMMVDSGLVKLVHDDEKKEKKGGDEPPK